MLALLDFCRLLISKPADLSVRPSGWSCFFSWQAPMEMRHPGKLMKRALCNMYRIRECPLNLTITFGMAYKTRPAREVRLKLNITREDLFNF